MEAHLKKEYDKTINQVKIIELQNECDLYKKDLSEFVKRTDGKSKDGYRNMCIACKTLYNRNYWGLTKEIQTENNL